MNVLIIDDEPNIRRVLRIGLERNGHMVALANSGEEGLVLARSQPPDMVILDLAMPGIGGMEACRRLRAQSSAPIIVFSVREDETDKVAALDAGADDYLAKPSSFDELRARMRAVARRCTGTEPEDAALDIGQMSIDFGRRRVTLGGRELHLTPTEFRLLGLLARHANHVVTHKYLLSQIWSDDPNHSPQAMHTLCVHIAALRAKIEPDPAHPRLLHTEPRIGYCLSAKSRGPGRW